MATEKILIFDEAGNAKRMKVRIARFLDNEPVTASDKTNIRTTLDVDGSQSGTFTTPLSVTSASDSSFTGGGKVGIGGSPSEKLSVSSSNTGRTGVSIDNTSTGGRNYIIGSVGSATDGGAAAGSFTIRDGNASANRLVLDSSGRVGVNQTSPGSFASNADDLVVGDGSQDRGITIASATNKEGTISFADGTTGDELYRGFAKYKHSDDSFLIGVAGQTRWTINSSGDLVSSGGGIDFGSVSTSAGDGTGTTGTPASSVLSDYESGSWVPTFATSGTNFATITTDVMSAKYVKVGRYVHCQAYIRTDDVDATGATGGVIITGLPFVADTSSSNYGQLSVGYSAAWVQAPDTGYIDPNNVIVRLFRSSTTGTSTIVPSDLTSGTTADRNQFIFTVSYIAST